ncbi:MULTISPECIES: DUF1294 domain-containing protein [Paenibacillus]|uniref:DUF1294 domain-containing protein n=1 Tax=Paenibacillus TaxID=44249 RepID=UPI0022B8C47F|nr:DUF1294 domain-containing protein [Paenibacillus caseinilyticus]MCZ8523434.1 DUF1294 domain-containing protein [Paenibacillus caseinilyticus]
MVVLLAYLAVMNAAGFAVMGSDKSRARKGGRRRVPEKRLFLLAGAGGSLGVWIAMRFFRHKTQHQSFVIGVPAILIVQVLAGLYVFDLLRSVR